MLLFPAFAAVSTKRSRGGELAQLVTHHVFGHKHLQVQLAVVNHEGVTDELGHSRASTSPGLDRRFIAGLVQSFHLHIQLGVDEGAFFERASHYRFWVLGLGFASYATKTQDLRPKTSFIF